MANIDAPFGFRQVGGLGSRPTSNGTSQYKIASGQTAAMYAGDVIALAGSGGLKVEGGTTVTAGYVGPSETDASRNVGIFNGCLYEDPTTNKPTFQNYWPGDVAAAADAFIYDDPSDLFEVQTDGTHSQAVAGRSCDMVYAAGSTVTNGRSKEELSSTAQASGGMFAVLRLSEDPSNNDVSTDNSNWIVKFNTAQHVYLLNI